MEVLKYLNIPLIEPQRVFVKDIVAQLEATGKDKKIIESHISTIKLVSLLNEQTIRIRSYKDDNYSFFAIYVFYIDLKIDYNITELCTLIHSAFPESTLLILNCNNKKYFSTASKRINKLDNTKTVLEDYIVTQLKGNYEQYINLSNIKGFNLKEYNDNLVKLNYKLKVLNITNIFPLKDANYKELIKEYEKLNSLINKLKQDYKQANMKSEKMRIDDELFEAELELKKLIKHIKGGQ